MSKNICSEYRMQVKKRELTKSGFKYTYVVYVRRPHSDNFEFVKECNDVTRSEYLRDKKMCK